MDDIRCWHHATAVRYSDGLVPQAHAQHRYRAGQPLDERQ